MLHAEMELETFRSENQDQDQDQFWPRAHWHYRFVLKVVRVKMATKKISFSLFICFKLDIKTTVYTTQNVFYVF